MKNKITVTGANITFFAFSVAFIAFNILIVIPAILLYGTNADRFALDYFIPITVINEYVIILVPTFIYVLIKKLKFKEVFRLNNPGLLPCLVIVLLAIPASHLAETANVIVMYLLSFIGDIPSSAASIPIPQDVTSLLISIFIIAVTPGICEELLNRGVIMKAYENRGTMKAVVISAILFGIFHYSILNLAGPIVLGILIGYYVIKTNSIFAGMLAHFLNNAYSMVMLYFARTQEMPKSVKVTEEDLAQSILIGLVSAVLVFLLLRLFNIVTKDKGVVMKPSISRVRDDIVSVISHWPMIVVMCLYFFMTLLTVVSIVLGP
jgi:membrane protease YdiL (CAAX protease family)